MSLASKTESKESPPPGPYPEDLEDEKYSFSSPYPQIFSIPENIIFYMAQNPLLVRGHRKAIQTCKSFFRMSRILPVKAFECDRNNSFHVAFITFSLFSKMTLIHLENPLLTKFWIYDLFIIKDELEPYFVTKLSKHIYKCELHQLILQNQALTFGELQLLAAGNKLWEIYFCKNVIKNGDDESVTAFENVFEVLLCEDMRITLPLKEHGIRSDTATKIAEILDSTKENPHHQICIKNIPENFDFLKFSTFLKTNMKQQKHTIDLTFINTISEEYKKQLYQFKEEFPECVKHGDELSIYYTGKKYTMYKQLDDLIRVRACK